MKGTVDKFCYSLSLEHYILCHIKEIYVYELVSQRNVLNPEGDWTINAHSVKFKQAYLLVSLDKEISLFKGRDHKGFAVVSYIDENNCDHSQLGCHVFGFMFGFSVKHLFK